MAVRNTRELCAGAGFALFGAIVIAYARQYDMGTATQMGPGYFPTLLGAVLVLLGGIACMQAFRSTVRVKIGMWPVVPTVFVLAGVLAFAALIDGTGLVPAVVALVLLACHDRLLRKPLEIAAICIAMLVLSVGIFIYGIQLPLGLW